MNRYYHGVDQGVYFNSLGQGRAWSGLVSVGLSYDLDQQEVVIDGVQRAYYTTVRGMSATVSCFDFPQNFGEAIGVRKVSSFLEVCHQPRSIFSFGFRSKLDSPDASSILLYHVVYGARIRPFTETHETYGDDPSPSPMDLELDTLVLPALGQTKIGEITFRSDEPGADQLVAILFGSVSADSRLPNVTEINSILGRS